MPPAITGGMSTPSLSTGCSARRSRRALWRPIPLALGCAALCSAGCSLAFVKGPPADHARARQVECTSSRALPIIDTVIGAAYLGSAASGGNGGTFTADPLPSTAATLGLAAVAGASAVYGFTQTAACSAARRRARERATPPLPGTCGRDVDCEGELVCEAGRCTHAALASSRLTLRLPTAERR